MHLKSDNELNAIPYIYCGAETNFFRGSTGATRACRMNSESLAAACRRLNCFTDEGCGIREKSRRQSAGSIEELLYMESYCSATILRYVASCWFIVNHVVRALIDP